MAPQAHRFNFHDDETLHDSTIASAGWWADPVGNTRAAATLFKGMITGTSTKAARKVVAELQVNDHLSQQVTKGMVSMLWGSMLHPPLSYQGSQFRYRSANGSYNNVLYPDLGKSRLPYAKTVQSKRAHSGARPDPGDLFDLLMARREDEKGRESKSGMSSMLLCHATVIIHDIFRTVDEDPTLSASSAYLDLAPLYGSTRKEQESMRTFELGKLKPDTFWEDRLVNQPPGVCIYLIMYNRFHNYVAEQLLLINENSRFSLPAGVEETAPPQADRHADPATNAYKYWTTWHAHMRKRDEDLFQTARLVTCGLYIQIAIHDYLRCLMLMHEKNTAWTLDPRIPYPEKDNHAGLRRGEGNMVSVEFNLLYRFHSPISRREAAWTEELMVGLMKASGIIEGTEPMHGPRPENQYSEDAVRKGEVPVPDFLNVYESLKSYRPTAKAKKKMPFFPEGFDRVVDRSMNPKQKFAFERNPKNGNKFDDEQLVAEMIRVIEDPICNFGPQNVPKVLKQIEILGTLQARKWEVATLNEFREFFGLPKHKHFEDINSDEDIQNKLRDLYEDPDQVELYPGLFCEGTDKVLDPGVSCSSGQPTALWRGVFSDAVTLVRSDRFYTLDWNVDSMTSWGFEEVASDGKVNKGSVFHKLFERAFPGFFSYNSLHMWQPFYTPTRNLQLAKEQGYVDFLDLRNLHLADPIDWYEWSKYESRVAHPLDATQLNGKWKIKLPLQADKVVIRQLNGFFKKGYRGTERAVRPPKPIVVSDFNTIKRVIMGGPTSVNWQNPIVPDSYDIPNDSLRQTLGRRWTGWERALEIATDQLNMDGKWEIEFMDYFVDLAQEIRVREERFFQNFVSKRGANAGKKVQVKQIDVVKDYAIPIVTRFIADYLGFWPNVKSAKNPERSYDENQIYKHIANCQNYQAWDSDLTKTWQNRLAYRDSIKFLYGLAEEGVSRSLPQGWYGTLERLISGQSGYGTTDDLPSAINVRRRAAGIVQALRKHFKIEQVIAIMLVTVLDTVQKMVGMFTEVLAYFIDPRATMNRDGSNLVSRDQQVQLWKTVVDAAWTDARVAGNHVQIAGEKARQSDKLMRKYVLEAHRACHYQPLIPLIYSPIDSAPESTAITVDASGKMESIKRDDLILLDLKTAYHDPTHFPNPDMIDPDRDESDYLTFAPRFDQAGGSIPRFTRRMMLIATTGMLKHVAHMSNLRVAHDKLGRLKRVKTPTGLDRYATPQWHDLVPYPTTWNLRFDGLGTEISDVTDNADQGHGGNQVANIEYFQAQLLQTMAPNEILKFTPDPDPLTVAGAGEEAEGKDPLDGENGENANGSGRIGKEASGGDRQKVQIAQAGTVNGVK